MRLRQVLAPALLDAASLVIFVVAGRASHHHVEELAGIASTIWPFALGTGAAWAVLSRRTRRGRWAPSLETAGAGVLVTVSTVVIGMVLRVVAGQGTAGAFVAVATGFFGLFMVGGRLLLRKPLRHLAR